MSELLKTILELGPAFAPPQYTPRRVVNPLLLLADIADPVHSEAVFATLNEAVRHLRHLPTDHPLYGHREDTEAAILLYAGTTHLTLPFCALPFLPEVPLRSLEGTALHLEAIDRAVQLLATHFRELRALNTTTTIPHIIHITPAIAPVAANATLEQRLHAVIPRHVKLQHFIVRAAPHPDILHDLAKLSRKSNIASGSSILDVIDTLSFTDIVITGGLHSSATRRVRLNDILSHD